MREQVARGHLRSVASFRISQPRKVLNDWAVQFQDPSFDELQDCGCCDRLGRGATREERIRGDALLAVAVGDSTKSTGVSKLVTLNNSQGQRRNACCLQVLADSCCQSLKVWHLLTVLSAQRFGERPATPPVAETAWTFVRPIG